MGTPPDNRTDGTGGDADQPSHARMGPPPDNWTDSAGADANPPGQGPTTTALAKTPTRAQGTHGHHQGHATTAGNGTRNRRSNRADARQNNKRITDPTKHPTTQQGGGPTKDKRSEGDHDPRSVARNRTSPDRTNNN